MAIENVRQALDTLKNIGIRMTPQRHAILSYLYQTASHPTADEIYRALEKEFPNMSVATVYNNLRVFREAGLVQELSFGDDSSRFEANQSIHYHVICRKCGHIEDFYYPCLTEMEQVASKKTGFIIESHRVELYGLCEKCQKTIQ